MSKNNINNIKKKNTIASNKCIGNGTNPGFEADLWLAVDKLRNNIDTAQYKHVVLGLIFLRYISDSFDETHQHIVASKGKGADPEDTSQYRAKNVFWVPKEARWAHLQNKAKQPSIGRLLNEAMLVIERENPRLKGLACVDYAQPSLESQSLGELIHLLGTIGLDDPTSNPKDILKNVYEFFIAQFAKAEGNKDGQFYTPQGIVRALVEPLAPYKGRVMDLCCGSGGILVESAKFVENNDGKIGDITVYGQESNPTTRRLAIMNLAIHGIMGDLGAEHADSLSHDLHKDLKADYVLANPPFNDSEWLRGEKDVRWKFGVPPKSNANYAWMQHIIHHLAPNGLAGIILTNSSLSSRRLGEDGIRRAIIEADLVDCIVALPGKMFHFTPMPICLWFIASNKKGDQYRNRSGKTLFIDARELGTMIDRAHRELTDEDTRRLADTYHAWRGDQNCKKKYQDIPGFCKSATKKEIQASDYVLTPGRYVGVEETKDSEPFDEKMQRLFAELDMQFTETRKMQKAIRSTQEDLGYGG